MRPIAILKAYFQQIARSTELLHEIRAGVVALNDAAYGGSSFGPRGPETPKIEVAPITDLPAPAISLDSSTPAEDIIGSPEFQTVRAYFAASPAASRALVSPDTQALLYLILRILRPAQAVEIGAFRLSTTEALTRAVVANGDGVIHTIDPFGLETVPGLLSAWPTELRAKVRFHPVTSMDFFGQAARYGQKFGLVFVDGNHDYEFALFDIQSAARALEPGGLIIADNIAQPGPYLAVLDFLAANPGWRQWGSPLLKRSQTSPFDRERTTIRNTDCVVLQSPRAFFVGAQPRSFGYVFWTEPQFSGVRLQLAAPARGRLRLQLIARTFMPRQVETILNQTTDIDAPSGEIIIPLPAPFHWPADSSNTVEPWLDWQGEAPLALKDRPEVT